VALSVKTPGGWRKLAGTRTGKGGGWALPSRRLPTGRHQYRLRSGATPLAARGLNRFTLRVRNTALPPPATKPVGKFETPRISIDHYTCISGPYDGGLATPHSVEIHITYRVTGGTFGTILEDPVEFFVTKVDWLPYTGYLLVTKSDVATDMDVLDMGGETQMFTDTAGVPVPITMPSLAVNVRGNC
jgi:hypothetical protein